MSCHSPEGTSQLQPEVEVPLLPIIDPPAIRTFRRTSSLRAVGLSQYAHIDAFLSVVPKHLDERIRKRV